MELFLKELCAKYTIKRVAYEDVTFTQHGYIASHLYGGFKSTLLSFASKNGYDVSKYSVGTIKKVYRSRKR